MSILSQEQLYVAILNIICITLGLVAFFIARSSTFFRSIIYLAIYSILACLVYLLLDAPDVAMTEAAIGACLTTVILLTIAHKFEGAVMISTKQSSYLAAILCSALGMSLLYLGYNITEYGSYNAVHGGDSKYYLANTKAEIGINSVVAAILASYRGFDTLGETTVVMMAGLASLMILSSREKDAK